MKPNKYKAVRTQVDGQWFASGREARRYCELRLLERAGEIRGLETQVSYPFRVNDILVSTYRSDFRYIDRKTGNVVVEDSKGVRTKEYIIKRKLMLAVYGIGIREV